MALHKYPTAAKIYSAAVDGTKADVTTNTKILIFSIHVHNSTAADAHLQCFDAQSGNVTVGTTAPTFTIGLDNAGGHIHLTLDPPILFTTGFTIASTTTRTGATGAAQEVLITYTDEA